ncbi:MAG: ATP-binding cassette domain-containing protein [Armatimonadota bacterium]
MSRWALTGSTTATYRRPVLTVEDVHVRFGGVQALRGVSLQVETGEIVAVIGPNGAGKTTVINTISGVHRPHQGRVLFDGSAITGRRPARIAALGVARTFQNVALFPSLSVLDNSCSAATSTCGPECWPALGRLIDLRRAGRGPGRSACAAPPRSLRRS